jgi:hypothetical protein
MRMPTGDRRAWILLSIGAALVCAGTFVGFFSGVSGVDRAFAHAETVNAPTPQDLAVELHRSVNASLVGFVIAMVGGLVLMTAVAKLRFTRDEVADTGADSFSSDPGA